MIRYTFLILAVATTAATAVAAITPANMAAKPANVTVIHMTEDFPFYGPVIVDECAVEDCSDE